MRRQSHLLRVQSILSPWIGPSNKSSPHPPIQAFTVFTDNSTLRCANGYECNRGDEAGDQAGLAATTTTTSRGCLARFDERSGRFELERPLNASSGVCRDEWACMVRARVAAGAAGDPTGPASENCTVLALEDEYCERCQGGSDCPKASTLYSVEPMASLGYWREAVKNTPAAARVCVHPDRPYCWDVVSHGTQELLCYYLAC